MDKKHKLSIITKRRWFEIKNGLRSDDFHTPEWRRKFGKSKMGEKNFNWSGDKVSYRALHKWIRKWKGIPNKCSYCGIGNKKIDWASKTKEYKRNLDEFIALCRSCHIRADRYNSIKIHG